MLLGVHFAVRTGTRGRSAAAGAAARGFPSVVKAQGAISMRWQSTWPARDIFHEYANDFAKKVNDMTGGDVKIEVLPAGAVVPAAVRQLSSEGALRPCSGGATGRSGAF